MKTSIARTIDIKSYRQLMAAKYGVDALIYNTREQNWGMSLDGNYLVYNLTNDETLSMSDTLEYDSWLMEHCDVDEVVLKQYFLNHDCKFNYSGETDDIEHVYVRCS